MAAALVWMALVRWCALLSLGALIGALVLETVVLPPGERELVRVQRRLRVWSRAAAIVLLLATAGELVGRAQTMSGGGLAAAIGAAPLVLMRTHFGTIWMLRAVALVLVLFLSWSGSRGARVSSLCLASGVALTTALIGHAADWGDLTVSVAVDWVHVMAAAAWTGGLPGLAIVALRERHAWLPALLATVVRRFSRLAGLCLFAVVLSGLYNAWVQIRSLPAVWTTPYGRVLLAKIAVFLVLAAIGAVNRHAIVPYLGSGRRPRGLVTRSVRLTRLALVGPRRASSPFGLAARLTRYVGAEAILALVVFGCTAVLGESTPGRHAGRHGRGQERRGPIHTTMEQLHESGGVPSGWSFAAPAGDEDRGRDVFTKLECFACHRVDGAAFPPPSRPGPDLTTVGAHHPTGYLVESIMNPNAVIVDGPGYTGPDGRSIMPDYRDSLTIADLIDLVAYLESLTGNHN
ncbi:MAG: hypothetical protein DMD81_14955 [Candidatus Rokuibacteriota bacterium]|nr:MAG: hypothetical protein DMD81_14955 [Candidatus Rokubacteria bacterium]